MRSIALLLVAPALAACSTTMEPTTRSAEAEAELQKLLAGKVAGHPTSCLPTYTSQNMVVIDDNTLAFRSGSRRVYVNHLRSGCERLGNGFYSLVTRSFGPGMCSGDIAQVAHLPSGVTVGSCVLGDFVPYTRP